MKKYVFIGKEGYANNLNGNYFKEGQITDYEPLVKRFPEFFMEYEMEPAIVEEDIVIESNDSVETPIVEEDIVEVETEENEDDLSITTEEVTNNKTKKKPGRKANRK